MINDNYEAVQESMAAHYTLDRRLSRFTAIFMSAAVLLAAGICALGWYTYTSFQNPDGSFARLTAVEQAMGTLDQNVKTNEAKVGLWDQQREELRQQIEKAGSDIMRRVSLFQKQTTDAVAAAGKQTQAHTDSQLSALHTRMTDLEAARNVDRTQLASQVTNLQQELKQVRGELSRQGDEISGARRDLNVASNNAERQIVSLRENTQRNLEDNQRNRQDVDNLAGKITTERVDFEIAKGGSHPIAPGISMNVSNINLPYHRVDGWMWVMPDRRTIWLKKQGVQTPIVYYGKEDGKKREVVITSLTKNGVVGYLLLPKAEGKGTAVAIAQ